MNALQVQWGESIVKLSFEKRLVLPPAHLITSAHGFCMYEGKLLMVDLNQRGNTNVSVSFFLPIFIILLSF